MAFYSRKTPRAQRYDYTSAGIYFITICTKNREHQLSEIINNKSILKPAGEIVDKQINNISKHRKHAAIHEYIIMPNHIHILILVWNIAKKGKDASSARPITQVKGPTYGSIWYIINLLKWWCTREINKQIKEWTIKLPFNETFARQSRYHDNIVKDEKAYNNIKHYIQNNPKKWEEDVLF